MFAQDEKDRLVNDIRDWVTKTGGNPTKDGCYAAFVNRVRDNLHLVLTMSPVGEAFRARCRQFPSLINCCTIDWFIQWPEEALLSVSQKFLANTDLGSDEVKEAMAHMCVKVCMWSWGGGGQGGGGQGGYGAVCVKVWGVSGGGQLGWGGSG